MASVIQSAPHFGQRDTSFVGGGGNRLESRSRHIKPAPQRTLGVRCRRIGGRIYSQSPRWPGWKQQRKRRRHYCAESNAAMRQYYPYFGELARQKPSTRHLDDRGPFLLNNN
jgi:hypothetical protein